MYVKYLVPFLPQMLPPNCLLFKALPSRFLYHTWPLYRTWPLYICTVICLSQHHGIMASWPHGIMASWHHGIMASWHHGIMTYQVNGDTLFYADYYMGFFGKVWYSSCTFLHSWYHHTQSKAWCEWIPVPTTSQSPASTHPWLTPLSVPTPNTCIRLHVHIQIHIHIHMYIHAPIHM